MEIKGDKRVSQVPSIRGAHNYWGRIGARTFLSLEGQPQERTRWECTVHTAHIHTQMHAHTRAKAFIHAHILIHPYTQLCTQTPTLSHTGMQSKHTGKYADMFRYVDMHKCIHLLTLTNRDDSTLGTHMLMLSSQSYTHSYKLSCICTLSRTLTLTHMYTHIHIHTCIPLHTIKYCHSHTL